MKKKKAGKYLGGMSGKAAKALKGRAAALKEKERIAMGGKKKKK